MPKGLEQVTLPTPQQGFDPQDEAQFRRALERFMATADDGTVWQLLPDGTTWVQLG